MASRSKTNMRRKKLNLFRRIPRLLREIPKDVKAGRCAAAVRKAKSARYAASGVMIPGWLILDLRKAAAQAAACKPRR
jgi:hypothetical protein